MRIGVYVGCFNPIHNGHKHVMDYLLKNNILDKILIIPTGDYWEKRNLLDVKYRAEMIKFYENENIIVDVKYSKISDTYKIFKKLNKDYKNNEFHLIMGADNLPKFNLWPNYKEILKNKVIVLQRNEIDIQKYINEYDEKENFIIIDDFEYINISSSKIRELLNQNDFEGASKYMVNQEMEYILQNKLY